MLQTFRGKEPFSRRGGLRKRTGDSPLGPGVGTAWWRFRRTGSDSSIGISQFFRVERLCHLETTRESAILVSLRFDCPTPGASIVYAVNKLAQAKRTGTLAPIVPLALTMMPLEGLPKCYSACCSRPDLYARRFPHYGSGAGFGSPCLRRCEKEASSLSAACARSFTRESFSKSANGFAVSMRPSS